jgi:hypothetical protein
LVKAGIEPAWASVPLPVAVASPLSMTPPHDHPPNTSLCGLPWQASGVLCANNLSQIGEVGHRDFIAGERVIHGRLLLEVLHELGPVTFSFELVEPGEWHEFCGSPSANVHAAVRPTVDHELVSGL